MSSSEITGCNRREVEERQAASLERNHTMRLEDGAGIIAPSTYTPSQEDELERKQQDQLEQQVYEKACQVLDSIPEESQLIVLLWADGMTLGQIADRLNTSPGNVRYWLKSFQEKVFEEPGE